MSLTRATCNLPDGIVRQFCQNHQPSALIPSSRHLCPALSLREEDSGAFRHHRLLRSQVVGRTNKAPPSPSQARRWNTGRRRLNPCMNLRLKTSIPQNAVIATRAPMYSQPADDLSLSLDRKSTRLNSSHSQISYAV